MGLFAADILAEHEVDEDEDEETDPSRLGALKLGTREAAARRFACTTCGAAVGARCYTRGGLPTACHKARYRLIEVEVPHGLADNLSAGHFATGTDQAGEGTQNS
jgi:hypothetical protein